MSIRTIVPWLRIASVRTSIAFFALAVCLSVMAAELELTTLRTRNGTFTNVVVMSQKQTEIYIRHTNGLANIRIADIEDDEALVALELKAAPPPKATAPPDGTSSSSKNENAAMQLQTEALAKFREVKSTSFSFGAVAAALGFILALYLFFCYCLKLICEKAGTETDLLVWLPLLQMIPAFRAAGMSAWWVLAMFVPVLNLVAQILWCFKITSARGKSILVAIALLLPLLNLFAFLYLAFSGTEES